MVGHEHLVPPGPLLQLLGLHEYPLPPLHLRGAPVPEVALPVQRGVRVLSAPLHLLQVVDVPGLPALPDRLAGSGRPPVLLQVAHELQVALAHLNDARAVGHLDLPAHQALLQRLLEPPGDLRAHLVLHELAVALLLLEEVPLRAALLALLAHALLLLQVEARLEGDVDGLALDCAPGPVGLGLEVEPVVQVDLLEGGLLAVREHLQLPAALLDAGQLHLLAVLLLHEHVQRLGPPVLLQEVLELLVGLPALLLALLQALQLPADLLPVLLALLVLQALPELLLQGGLLALPGLLRPLDLLHALLEPPEVLVDLPDPLLSALGPPLGHSLKDVPDVHLHLQRLPLLLPLRLPYPAGCYFPHHFLQLLVSDLPYPIFQYLAIDLAVVDIPQKLSIVSCEVPKGALLDVPCSFGDRLLVGCGVAAAVEQAGEESAFVEVSLGHYYTKLL